MPAGRIAEVACDILPVLKAELCPSLAMSSMCPYPTVDFRKRIRWPDVNRNRVLMLSLFRCSGGHLIRQTCVHQAVKEFARSEGVETQDLDKESERLAYRIRAQMSGLREARSSQRAPPPRFCSLSSVLDEIVLKPPKPSSSPAGAEALLDAAPVECISLLESDVDCSADAGGASQYQDIDMDCFDTPAKKSSKPLVALATPPKVAAPLVDDADMDKWLADDGAKAPDAGQYRAFAKACKKNLLLP